MRTHARARSFEGKAGVLKRGGTAGAMMYDWDVRRRVTNSLFAGGKTPRFDGSYSLIELAGDTAEQALSLVGRPESAQADAVISRDALVAALNEYRAVLETRVLSDATAASLSLSLALSLDFKSHTFSCSLSLSLSWRFFHFFHFFSSPPSPRGAAARLGRGRGASGRRREKARVRGPGGRRARTRFRQNSHLRLAPQDRPDPRHLRPAARVAARPLPRAPRDLIVLT